MCRWPGQMFAWPAARVMLCGHLNVAMAALPGLESCAESQYIPSAARRVWRYGTAVAVVSVPGTLWMPIAVPVTGGARVVQRVNTERRGLVAGGIVGLAGLLLLTLPSLLGVDGMSGGFALGVLGLLVAILGVVMIVLFRPRARVLGRMLSGEDLLVHWEFDSPQFERQVERDTRAQLAQNRGLLLIVAIWWVIWVAFFMVLGYAEGNGHDMPTRI